MGLSKFRLQDFFGNRCERPRRKVRVRKNCYGDDYWLTVSYVERKCRIFRDIKIPTGSVLVVKETPWLK